MLCFPRPPSQDSHSVALLALLADLKLTPAVRSTYQVLHHPPLFLFFFFPFPCCWRFSFLLWLSIRRLHPLHAGGFSASCCSPVPFLLQYYLPYTPASNKMTGGFVVDRPCSQYCSNRSSRHWERGNVSPFRILNPEKICIVFRSGCFLRVNFINATTMEIRAPCIYIS